jgi:hypothetical protein
MRAADIVFKGAQPASLLIDYLELTVLKDLFMYVLIRQPGD